MVFFRRPSFVFNSLQPLFPNHPGGGYPSMSRFRLTNPHSLLCVNSAPSAPARPAGGSQRYPSPSLLFAPLDDSCALLYLPLESTLMQNRGRGVPIRRGVAGGNTAFL